MQNTTTQLTLLWEASIGCSISGAKVQIIIELCKYFEKLIDFLSQISYALGSRASPSLNTKQ